MIKVFSFRPEYFNNNGDQGNLEALKHYLQVEFQESTIEDADFVLFGDGSRAALREFAGELLASVPYLKARLDSGQPTLLVGATYELLAPHLTGSPALSYTQRASEFREATSAGVKVRGYRNSELDGGDLYIKGAFVMTTLFGPVLAKNLELIELFARSLGITPKISSRELEWISKI